jgi:hypothetical protein
VAGAKSAKGRWYLMKSGYLSRCNVFSLVQYCEELARLSEPKACVSSHDCSGPSIGNVRRVTRVVASFLCAEKKRSLTGANGSDHRPWPC